jgi:hypothetical protein
VVVRWFGVIVLVPAVPAVLGILVDLEIVLVVLFSSCPNFRACWAHSWSSSFPPFPLSSRLRRLRRPRPRLRGLCHPRPVSVVFAVPVPVFVVFVVPVLVFVVVAVPVPVFVVLLPPSVFIVFAYVIPVLAVFAVPLLVFVIFAVRTSSPFRIVVLVRRSCAPSCPRRVFEVTAGVVGLMRLLFVLVRAKNNCLIS